MEKDMRGPTDHPVAPQKKRSRAILIGAATAVAVTLAGVAGAQALTAAHVKHYIECFGWMITDPDTHADNCLPGHIPPLESLSSDGGPPPPDYLDDTSQDDSFRDDN